MRKYPLQAQARYCLGRQLDQTSANKSDDEPIYTSANGDSWSLARDPISGARAVRHQPNQPSGGQVSYIDIDEFLLGDAVGPEHQALRQLIEKRRKPSTILIGYDVHPPHGDTQDKLETAIRALGTWWHHLETIWIVRSDHTSHEILEKLRCTVGNEDQLLVIDISGDIASWSGINDLGDKWLKDNIAPKEAGSEGLSSQAYIGWFDDDRGMAAIAT